MRECALFGYPCISTFPATSSAHSSTRSFGTTRTPRLRKTFSASSYVDDVSCPVRTRAARSMPACSFRTSSNAHAVAHVLFLTFPIGPDEGKDLGRDQRLAICDRQ